MLAQTNPLLVILEDAHWADASSIEFFDELIPTLRKLPALLIISTRGGGIHAWTGQERISTMSLARLGQRQAAGPGSQYHSRSDLIAGSAGKNSRSDRRHPLVH